MKILTAKDASITVVRDVDDPTDRVVEIQLGERCKATVEFFIGMDRQYGTDIIYTHMLVEFKDAYGNPLHPSFDVLVGDLYGTDMGEEYEEGDSMSEDGYFYDDAVQDAVRQLVPLANLVLRTDEADVVTLHHGQILERITDYLLQVKAPKGALEWLKANVDLTPVAQEVGAAIDFDEPDNALDDAIQFKTGGESILTRFMQAFNLKKD